MKNISVVVLAAGFGTRMKSNKAKVLHKISNYPMLYHIIKTAKEISSDISIVVFNQKELVEQEMSKYFDDLNFCVQDMESFPGTGGGVMVAKPKFNKTIIINGDTPLLEPKDLKDFVNSEAKLTLGYFNTENPYGYGRVILENDKVLKIVEQKDASESEKQVKTVNAGIYCFDTEFLKFALTKLDNNNAQKEFYLTDTVKIALQNNIKIKGLVVDEINSIGINTKAHLEKAEVLMQSRIKEKLMNEGVIMHFANSIFIDPNAKFIGECEIHQNVSIYGDCCIENSEILANSLIENSTIKNSKLGPFARIRPKSNISNSKIGNFVEIKNSNLQGVKAGHLSYLGDSDINDGTNVGCGVITCNYDGVKKHKTIIGKNVFIGSDTQFIAPIKVEDEVIIAAGTTVTKNLKSGVLAIDRQKNGLKQIDGFYKKFFEAKNDKS